MQKVLGERREKRRERKREKEQGREEETETEEERPVPVPVEAGVSLPPTRLEAYTFLLREAKEMRDEVRCPAGTRDQKRYRGR